jgi:hypothetical protein
MLSYGQINVRYLHPIADVKSRNPPLIKAWRLRPRNRDPGMTFEIVPMVPSQEAREGVAPFPDTK